MRQTSASASLPRDDDSAPMQVLSPKAASTVHLTATEAADDSIALTSGSEIVRVAASGNVWLAFGPAAVDAASGQSDSFLFPAGVEVFNLRDSNFTWVAARSVTGAGNVPVTVTTME